MKKKTIEKIVLLTDDSTSVIGRRFMDVLASVLQKMGKQVKSLYAGMDQGVEKAINTFDQIAKPRPDLLIVADFACICMQSSEEEPMYNNLGIPTIHLLFERPWEYRIFMNYRCDFTTRVYCLLKEDVSYIKTFYPSLLNVYALESDIFDMDAHAVCYAKKGTITQLKEKNKAMPEYMKTLENLYEKMKDKEPELSDVDAMRKCLNTIQFTCSISEYMDILYMMRDAFALYYLKKTKQISFEEPQINEASLCQQCEIFLDMDFPVTLL